MEFSVIIPTLNEAAAIGEQIESVRALNPEAQIIISDGGSRDGTASIARQIGVDVIESSPGRGTQCNTGAGMASRDILLFLHADTYLPADAFEQLEANFGDDQVQIGTFRLSFDFDHWLLRLYCLPSRFNLPFTHYGDQCIVARRSFFEAIGGFPEWPLFEDVELMNRARKVTRIHRFPSAVRTSARRYQRNGILRQQMINTWYTLRYLTGTSPDTLAQKYHQHTLPSKPVSVAVFARFPRPGRVKTRLAGSLGTNQATEFYRLCAEHAFRECEKIHPQATLYVFFDEETDAEVIEKWIGPGFKFHSQTGADLGERLLHAFQSLFDRGAEKALIMASDTPDISDEIIDLGIRKLDGHDVVIGPCPDGGYYLIGMKKPHPELFADIPWSTGDVYRQTVEVIHRLKLHAAVLPMLFDIDTVEDMAAWLATDDVNSCPALRRYAHERSGSHP